MCDEAGLEVLNSIERKLNALVALGVRQLQAVEEGLAKPRHPSLDSLLTDAGLSQAQIALILGKRQSNVSRQLSRDKAQLSRDNTASRD